MNKRFAALHAQLHLLERASEWKSVLKLATDAVSTHPHFYDDLMLRRVCAAAALGDHDLANRLFSEALDAGSWFPAGWLRGDEPLSSMQGDPEFERLSTISLERERAAARGTGASVMIAAPEAPAPWPSLLVLHGNTENASMTLPLWRSATADGWCVAAAQAATPAGPNMWVWGAASTGDVTQAAQLLTSVQGVDSDRVVLGGFSRGSWHALRCAVVGHVQARGVICVAPSMRTIDEITGHLPAAAERGLRVVMIAGDRDPLSETAPQIADHLEQAGLQVRLHIIEGLHHEYPDGFATILQESLRFALEV